jgi:protein-ribulosamine 3-kinase
MLPWPVIAAQISHSTGKPFTVEKAFPVGGGCINRTYRLEGDGKRFFVKLNSSGSLLMFDAEAAGLQEISSSRALRVPKPLCWGDDGSSAWLVLEYVEMGGGQPGSAAALGSALAAMHHVSAEQFGWSRDNTIGATRQINDRSSDWVEFWHRHRLGYQLQLGRMNGYSGRLQTEGEQLIGRLDAFFLEQPVASLLHGDLWSGNYSFDDKGHPVLFDPAVYYGDREADIAMTELFGGFSHDFYAAYREAYPLDPGYRVRKTLYNLYHILNHLNLFGGGYLRQAEQMISYLLSESR